MYIIFVCFINESNANSFLRPISTTLMYIPPQKNVKFCSLRFFFIKPNTATLLVVSVTLVEVAAKFYRHLQKMSANFYKTWKIQGPCMEILCRLTMQLSLFELKLKTFPLLHHRDHFVFTRKFLKY